SFPFFFFQAEDGIRDFHVTGVQTCALPILTSRPSLACVQSAWTVYMPLPSASSDSTLRSGHATAAPVAAGMPKPIAPPVRSSQSDRKSVVQGKDRDRCNPSVVVIQKD